MAHIYAVTVMAKRYRGFLELKVEVCCVVADSFPEAMEKGREKLLDREDIHPDDGWEIVTTKACAPDTDEILAVAEDIKVAQAEADWKMGESGLRRWIEADQDEQDRKAEEARLDEWTRQNRYFNGYFWVDPTEDSR